MHDGNLLLENPPTEQGFTRMEEALRVLIARLEPLLVLTREYLGSSLTPEGLASRFRQIFSSGRKLNN